MFKSKQRLGDNPKDHDGHFPGLDDALADVATVRPDSDFKSNTPSPSPFTPWKIYPPPPPPHWHWTDNEKVIIGDSNSTRKDLQFDFKNCPIPKSDPWGFEIDEKGVFQVYKNVEGNLCLLLFISSLNCSFS